ncbi:positive regulation of MHC class I biosynthetic process [Branchiostoma belcheri]|nr:positive regulation of MHC class I biosynthetic process [Branchiostoma belcheri]
MDTEHGTGIEHHMDEEPPLYTYRDAPSTDGSFQKETETDVVAGLQQEQTELMYQAQQQEEPFCYHCYYQLMLLANRLGPYWTWLALQLGFTSTDVERISSTYHPSDQPHWCLWEWIRGNYGEEQWTQYELETGELFEKDVDDGSWGSEGKGQGYKGDGSNSDGDTDDDGDSGGAARKAKPRPSTTHASQISTINLETYPTGEDALAWNDCLQDFFKADEDTAKSIQESWPTDSDQPQSAFQFVHESIQQFLMACWIAHAVRTQTDCTELLRLPNLQELALCVSCQGEEEGELTDQLYRVQPPLKFLNLRLRDWSLYKMTRLLTLMLQQFPLLEAIDLSDSDISNEAVPGLVEGLGSCQNLKKVNLSSNKLSGRGDFLPPLPNLEHIDLSHNDMNDEAVPDFAEGLSSELEIQTVGNNISDDLVSLLANKQNASQVAKLFLMPGEYPWGTVHPLPITTVSLLLQFLPQLPSLQELALSVSCQGEEEGEHINQPYGAQPPLKILNLRLGDWSLDNMTRLLTLMLQQFPLLEAIDLSDSDISNEAVPGLVEGLGSCQNLKKVNLSSNKLSGRGDFLPPLPNLEHIDLSHNDMNDEAVPDFAEGLSSCENLKNVDLSFNGITNKGALLMLLHERCRQLEIQTVGNNISDDLVSLLANKQNASQVAKLFLMPGEYPWGTVHPLPITAVSLLLRFLPQLPNLQELALCVSCQGEEEGELTDQMYGVQPPLKFLNLRLRDWSLHKMTRLLTLMLKQFPLLEAIDLSDSDISSEAVPGLVEGLGSCQNLKDVYLGGNKLSDVGELIEAFITFSFLTNVDISNNSIRDESLPTIATWLNARTAVTTVYLYGNRFSAEGVREFVRTMKGKAYLVQAGSFELPCLVYDLPYDGTEADVSESAEPGGEGARREEQQWERFRSRPTAVYAVWEAQGRLAKLIVFGRFLSAGGGGAFFDVVLRFDELPFRITRSPPGRE